MIISAVDLVYYAPHVLASASDADDVRAIIDEDRASLASNLRSHFEEGAEYRRSRRAYVLASSDDADNDPALALERRQFRLWEVERDIRASHTSQVLQIPAPTDTAPLEIRPTLSCVVVDSSWLVLENATAAIDTVANFAVGQTLIVRANALRGRTCLQINRIEEQRLHVLGADALMGATTATIVAVEVADPMRMLAVQEFHAFRDLALATSASEPGGAAMLNFNETLYRILYSPAFPALASMGPEEVFSHYTARPGSIGSVDELKRAMGGASAGHSRVDDRLALAPGASIQFPAPFGGTVSGIVTSARLDERRSHAIADTVLPTECAVRYMIDSAATDEKITRYLEVDGVLYASREFEGVHCTSTVDIEGDVRCLEMACEGPAFARSIVCRDSTTCELLESEKVRARTLSIGAGAVYGSADGLDVTGPALRCRRLECGGDVHVAGSSYLGVDARALAISSDRIDVTSDLVCHGRIDTLDATVRGNIRVDGRANVTALEVDGIDVAAELRALRAELASARLG